MISKCLMSLNCYNCEARLRLSSLTDAGDVLVKSLNHALDEAIEKWREFQHKCSSALNVDDDPMLTQMCQSDVEFVVNVLRKRPIVSHSLFPRMLMLLSICVGELLPEPLLVSVHGPILTSLLTLSLVVPPEVANVARVTARNFARRLSPEIFTERRHDADLVGWIIYNLQPLRGCSDKHSNLLYDRKFAILFLDMMGRMSGASAQNSFIPNILESLLLVMTRPRSPKLPTPVRKLCPGGQLRSRVEWLG